MVPDRQKVWMDGQKDGMDGRSRNYIPPTSSGAKKYKKSKKKVRKSFF